MKKIFALIILLIFVLSGCADTVSQLDKDMLDIHDSIDENDNTPGFVGDLDEDIMLFSWFSYPEIMPDNMSGTKEEYRKKLGGYMQSLAELGVSDVFVQVRPFADAIYPSELFESSGCVVGKRGDALAFDYLELIIEEAEKKGLKVHGWINPYRIQSQADIEKLDEKFSCFRWYSDGSGDVKEAAGGLYFSPSSMRVRKLITDGVRELMSNYELAGIHIDDYFYPTDEKAFDEEEYSLYVQQGGNLSLEDWRRANVSALLNEIYCTVKSFGSEKLFTVSPSGDIEKNKNVLFADVELWSREEGYCDMIIPQLYFGFDHSTKPFEKCVLQWKNLVNGKIKLGAGLALYKAGEEDAFAGAGKDEWKSKSDIISRQYEYLVKNGFEAVGIYSTSFVNFNEIPSGKETQNLKNMLS